MAKLKSFKFRYTVLAVVLSMAMLPTGLISANADHIIEYPHGINVTYYGDPYTQRGVTWITQKDVVSSEVEVVEKTAGLKEDAIDWKAAKKFAGTTEYTKGENFKEWCNSYKAVVTGLIPGKQYYYRIVANKADSKVYSQKVGVFTMAEKDAESVKFVAFTDQQQSSKGDYEAVDVVLQAAIEMAPDADFFLSSGDFVNSSNSDYIKVNSYDQVFGEWNWHFDSSADMYMNYPMVAVAGNHESDEYIYYDHFHYDWAKQENGEEHLTEEGGYYSLEIGDVFVGVINSNIGYNKPEDPDRVKMVNWLKNELKNTTASWKILTLHHTPYDPGSYNGDSHHVGWRNQLGEICSEYNVDMVIAGHTHRFLRTLPYSWEDSTGLSPVRQADNFLEIYNGRNIEYQVEPNGTVYQVLNTCAIPDYTFSYSSWTNLYPATMPNGKPAAAGPSQAMYAVIEVTDYSYTQITYTVDAYGNSYVYDYFGMMKDVEKEAQELTKAIEELPQVELATFDDLDKVREVNKKYHSATNVVLSKISVENVNKLYGLVEKLDYESVQIVQFVQREIDKITNVTLDSIASVNQAERYYNALTDDEKALIDNTKLFEAKVEIVELQIDAIIPGSSNFKKKVKTAEESYNALSTSQKAYVANYQKLQSYLAEIDDGTQDVDGNENQSKKGGCSSVIGLTGLWGTVLLTATAFVTVNKKRKED